MLLAVPDLLHNVLEATLIHPTYQQGTHVNLKCGVGRKLPRPTENL